MKRKPAPKVQGVIAKIIRLKERVKSDKESIRKLEGLLIVAKNDTPRGEASTKVVPQPEIDLKDAIMEVFNENKTQVLKINDIVRSINLKHNFMPDKLTITNRLNYLADRSHKLERGEKRGLYRLAPLTPGASGTGG